MIPADPSFVPSEHRREAARQVVARMIPAAAVRVALDDHPVFVDAGANWEGGVRCPRCRAELDYGWWAERTSESYEGSFDDLAVTTPCCGAPSSLNDLDYDWPVGFARYRIIVVNPTAGVALDLAPQVSQVLGYAVRIIHRHL